MLPDDAGSMNVRAAFDRMMLPMEEASRGDHATAPPAAPAAHDDLGAVSQAAATTSRPPRRRRSAHPLLVAAVVGGLAVIVLGVLYGRVYTKRSEMLRVQQTCLDHAAPADQVVYDENADRAKELSARGGEYASIPAGGSSGGTPVAGYVPTAWREMRRWALPLQPEPTGAVLFLHERRTHVGAKQVLVCVEADRANRKLRITVIHPGASTLDPAPITDLDLAPPPQPDLVVMKTAGEPFEAKLPANANERADLRFFAGQFDRNDPTRFNLPYEFNGERGEFDCWLEDERVVYYVDRRFERK
jgi:hypothetical protein